MLQTYIISLHMSKSKFILVFSSAQLQLRSLLPRATLFSLIQLTILFLSSPPIIIIIPSTCPYLSSSNCHTLKKEPLAIISWECVWVSINNSVPLWWSGPLHSVTVVPYVPCPLPKNTLCVSPQCGKFSAKWSDIYMNLKKPKWEVLCWS